MITDVLAVPRQLNRWLTDNAMYEKTFVLVQEGFREQKGWNGTSRHRIGRTGLQCDRMPDWEQKQIGMLEMNYFHSESIRNWICVDKIYNIKRLYICEASNNWRWYISPWYITVGRACERLKIQKEIFSLFLVGHRLGGSNSGSSQIWGIPRNLCHLGRTHTVTVLYVRDMRTLELHKLFSRLLHLKALRIEEEERPSFSGFIRSTLIFIRFLLIISLSLWREVENIPDTKYKKYQIPNTTEWVVKNIQKSKSSLIVILILYIQSATSRITTKNHG